ncbi:hypothetical protein PoB_002620600 [Plakobranchus ocellatus]|uniref:Uncharacterized protein n=1 Tax=Plakobranchus ocellatus TaxID=259542 RepID=A0AAV3ZYT9_9GAST|nr:hypothetical protein PoB_002620600 [Plakobranchus ocellatus]
MSFFASKLKQICALFVGSILLLVGFLTPSWHSRTVYIPYSGYHSSTLGLWYYCADDICEFIWHRPTWLSVCGLTAGLSVLTGFAALKYRCILLIRAIRKEDWEEFAKWSFVSAVVSFGFTLFTMIYFHMKAPDNLGFGYSFICALAGSIMILLAVLLPLVVSAKMCSSFDDVLNCVLPRPRL